MSPKALTLLAIAVVAAPALAYPLPPHHAHKAQHPSSPVPQELEQQQPDQSGALSFWKKFIPHIPGSFGKRSFEEDDLFARSFESDEELFAREPEPSPRLLGSPYRNTFGGYRSPGIFRRGVEFEDLTARDDVEDLVAREPEPRLPNSAFRGWRSPGIYRAPPLMIARDDFEDITARDDLEELFAREPEPSPRFDAREDMEDIFARSMDSESELFAREPEPEPFGHDHRFTLVGLSRHRHQPVEAREYEELLEREEVVGDLFERSFDDAEELLPREDVDDMLMARAFDLSGDLEERSFDDLD